jgi:hypothetical protein
MIRVVKWAFVGEFMLFALCTSTLLACLSLWGCAKVASESAASDAGAEAGATDAGQGDQ